MESKSSEPVAAPAQQNERRSMMPVVAGVGIVLAVIAAIALWPKSDGDSADGKKRAKAGVSAKGEDGDGAVTASSKGGAGVAARAYDDPNAPGGSGRMNPAVRLPNVGMAPEGAGGAPPKDEPPATFASKAEEIAWYEGRLERATKTLEARKKFYDRLPSVRERIASGPDPQRQLDTFEGRKKIVEENYAKAQADVLEVEKKLKELRGS